MLTETLDALLSSVDGIRKHGEQLLIEAEQTDLELGVKLTRILKDEGGTIAHRQLCGILLKQYILNHWQNGSPNFRPPEVPDHAKMTIREILPDCLGDAERSVRASAAYAVAAVAAFDWPTHWPDLIEALVNAVASCNARLVHGAMHALSDLAALITERQNELQSVLERFSQALFPHLLKILVTHDDTYSVDTRKRGVTVFHTLAKSIFDNKSACKRTLMPWVASYSEALIVCVEAALTTSSIDFDFVLRILQTLSWLWEHFPQIVALSYGERLVGLLIHLLRRVTEELRIIF
uniref:Importin N-terminal domain-containing protein n=1 Tax=Plectus sambesii TaxID=2011161 RepID=A0A914VHN1_9BILA